ncbi:MAG: hypothetical protein AAF921_17410 [Cyanobacteria bacterium P01_D01_bin.44]
MKLLKAIHPIFLLALGLHAALLMIPISGSSDEIIPAPDPEGETISVTRIPTEDDKKAAAAVNPATSPQTVATKPAQSNRPAQQAQSGTPRTNAQQRGQSGRSVNGASNRANGRNARGSDRTVDNRNADNRDADNRNVDEEIANLGNASSPPPPPSSGDTSPANATPPASPQEPLTLAALLEKAKRPVSEQLKDLLALFSTAYNYQAERTNDAAEAQARDSWLAGIRDRTGIAVEPEPLETPVKIPYPLEREDSFLQKYGDYEYDLDFVACLKEAPQPAVVGIAFDQAGAIAHQDPVILRSTGYEFLNQEALERVKQYEDFPLEKAQKAYTIDVEIDHDNERCPVVPTAEVTEGEGQTEE